VAAVVGQRDDRHAERGLEGGRLQPYAAFHGLLDEVQRHHHRSAEFGQLEREGQVAGEVRRVDHVDDQRLGVGHQGGEDDVLLGAGASQGVRAG